MKHFALLIFFMIIFISAEAQVVPSYLLSNDIPYANKANALTFCPTNSDFVLFFEHGWHFYGNDVFDPKDTLNWLPLDSLENAESSDKKIILLNKFVLKDDQQGKKLVLHLPKSPFRYHVEINGHKLQKELPHELSNNIELTSVIKEGSNLITLQCNPGDGLRQFLNNIYLVFLQDIHLANLYIRAFYNTKTRYNDFHLFNDTYNFTGQLIHSYTTIPSMYSIHERNPKNYLSYEVNQLTYGPSYPIPVNKFLFKDTSLPQKNIDFFGVIIPKSKKWSTEHNELYHVSCELLNKSNDTVGVYSTVAGVRNVSVADGKLMINGKFAQLKAVHYAPAASDSREKLSSDLALFKRHNVNTLYISSTKINDTIIDLCDQYGLYVILDVTLSDFKDTDYRATARDIFTHLVLTYVDHPCMIAWAIKHTENDDIKQLNQHIEMFRELIHEYASWFPLLIITSNTEFAQTHPQRNRLALGLEEETYNNNLYKIGDHNYPVVVFDRTENDVVTAVCKQYLDVMENGHPANIQGLVLKQDILKNVALREYVKYRFRDVKLQWIENTEFQIAIENNFNYTNFSELSLTLTLLLNDEKIAKKSIDSLNVPPGKLELYQIPLDHQLTPDKTYQLRLTASLGEDKIWAKKGYVVSEEKVYFIKGENGNLNLLE